LDEKYHVAPAPSAIAPSTAVVATARHPAVGDRRPDAPNVSDAPVIRRNHLRMMFIAVLDKIRLPIYDKLDPFSRQQFLDANIRPRQ
jgi:hypothetical protein